MVPAGEVVGGETQAEQRGGAEGNGRGEEPEREDHTADTVQRRQVPSQLRLVDGQVRRHRSVLALRDEDLLLARGRRLGRGDHAARCRAEGARPEGARVESEREHGFMLGSL